VATTTIGSPAWIKDLRKRLDLTQSELADRLGVTFVTISRWENDQAKPNRLAIRALMTLAAAMERGPGAAFLHEARGEYWAESKTIIDFRADPEAVRLLVEGERLRYGHLFSPVFGIETALIDPLPHQWIAVYQHMLTQPRLRFLLADDAGAGKTIMTGLYVRELLNRRLIRRVMVIPPAGLVGNWKREMTKLFSLSFREVTGADCRDENPFAGPPGDLVLISVDTLAGGRAFDRLIDPSTDPYDLVVFDEAHRVAKLKLIPKMMQECRKYGILFILSSQRVEDFDQGVLDSAGNHLYLRVNHPDARRLAAYLGNSAGASDSISKLQNLPKYHALFRSEDYQPFAAIRLAEP